MSDQDGGQGGYATAAAVMISLALSVTTAAAMQLSLGRLAAARGEARALERAYHARAALAEAEVQLEGMTVAGPVTWGFQGRYGWVEARAVPVTEGGGEITGSLYVRRADGGLWRVRGFSARDRREGVVRYDVTGIPHTGRRHQPGGPQ